MFTVQNVVFSFLRFILALGSVVFSFSAVSSVRNLAPSEYEAIIQSLEHVPLENLNHKPQNLERRNLLLGGELIRIDLPFFDISSKKISTLEVPVLLPPMNKERLDTLPFVVISATIEGNSVFEAILSRRFVAKGYAVAIMDVNSFPYKPGLQGVQEIYMNSIRAIHAYRTMIDWIKSDQTTLKSKSRPVYAFGASNGTLTVTAATAVDPRIDRTFLVSAIGDIPSIYSNSAHPKIQQFRQATMLAEGLETTQDLMDFLKKNIPSDPTHLSPHLSAVASKIFQVVTTRDKIIRFGEQLSLVDAMDRSAMTTVRNDHMLGILRTTFGKQWATILEHFELAQYQKTPTVRLCKNIFM